MVRPQIYRATVLQLDSITNLFDAPTLRLLRSDHAPFVVGFLAETFKSNGKLALAHDDLCTKLLIFIDQVNDQYPKGLRSGPERYLTEWSDAGWLLRFLQSGTSEPQYQLTPFSENAIQVVETLMSRRTDMVGTEGRLRVVMDTLTDLVRGSSNNREQRIAHLTRERNRIESELQSLEDGGPVRVYNSAQIRERFQLAVESLRSLQSDFRAVEERFHQIAHDVHRRQQDAIESRGQILSHALDAEELLKQQDEGISFYAFISLLFSPDSQSNLRETISEVVGLEEIQDQQASVDRLKQMLPSLLAEADKVLRTNSKLTASLRRLLDRNRVVNRKRTTAVLSEIRSLAAAMRDNPPTDRDFVSVQTSEGIASPFARSFWQAPVQFEQEEPTQHVVDLTQADSAGNFLAGLYRLDLQQLRGNISQLTKSEPTVSWQAIVDAFPPEAGVVELIGYLQIAFEDGQNIDRGETEDVVLVEHESDREIVVRLPRVDFRSPSESLQK